MTSNNLQSYSANTDTIGACVQKRMGALEISKKFSDGRRFFEQKEQTPKTDGLSVRETLVENHRWTREQCGTVSQPYKIDIDAYFEPCIVTHPKVEKKTKIGPKKVMLSDLLAPGKAILFDADGITLAKLRWFFLYGLKAFDQISWQNFIIEGLCTATAPEDTEPFDYNNTYDRWWYITETLQTTFRVYGFSHNMTVEFPYLVLTSADFVRIKNLNEEEQEVWNDFIEARREAEMVTSGDFLREGLSQLMSNNWSTSE